nr:MAG TPA: hypothetical protein [Bacteriophage sp.]
MNKQERKMNKKRIQTMNETDFQEEKLFIAIYKKMN